MVEFSNLNRLITCSKVGYRSFNLNCKETRIIRKEIFGGLEDFFSFYSLEGRVIAYQWPIYRHNVTEKVKQRRNCYLGKTRKWGELLSFYL